MKSSFLSHMKQFSKCNRSDLFILHICLPQDQNLHLLVKQGVKIFLLFQALTSFARDSLGYGHDILCKHLSFRSIFSSQEPLRMQNPWRSLVFILFFFCLVLWGFFCVQAYFAVMGCDFQHGCALDCPVLGGSFLHELLCINKPMTTMMKNAGFRCKSASAATYF